ncbi:MAG TPA: Cys-tRNA(Pro) deacylase [Propionicimonas sp.]|nr:Cys-tRNA(Pro) deacylase [Propionicimonas sp.]HQA77667.1 Cys-tRNA(Pro) deacylase [Propionicimonas sp.]HQD97185.1 Cys-tRNA(Pro) deacylase [Propionicimonas sp.]
MAGATPAIEALLAAGIAHTLHPYDHDPLVTAYGDETVAALGVDPLRVFKTLVLDVGATRPELAVGVVPVAGQLDLKHFATALGVKKAAMAAADLVARSTGYVLGGVSPLAQKNSLPTIIDETAELWDTIYVSAGRRGLQVELAPNDLAAVVSARFADIAR